MQKLAAAAADPTFTHLAVHSHYSLLEATPSVEELAAQAAADGMSHLALADSHALYGVIAFERACRASGVQPIPGMTISVRRPAGETGVSALSLGYITTGHLVLLATGPSGYVSLSRLSSLLQTRPDRASATGQGLTWEELQVHASGLICLSGGRSGWIARYLEAGDQDAAARFVAGLGAIYGDNLWLALELHGRKDIDITTEIAALAGRFGLPVAAVQPVYTMKPSDAPRLRLLAAIDRNVPLESIGDGVPGRGEMQERHWLSPEQVATRFEHFPEAIEGVKAIAARCRPALPGSRPIWPVLKLPEGQSATQALTGLARAGMAQKYGPDIPETISLRLEKELAAINGSGFAPLFLIVADVVRFARQTNVPVSTRGSVANSLVAYCSGITTVDPIANDLLFERFLNPARSSLPDIDLDFCSRRRDEVLSYVRRTYGEERVALVATISTLRPKSAVRETAKAFGLPSAEISRLARKVPQRWHPDPGVRGRFDVDDMLKEVSDPGQQAVIRAAAEIVGQPHHLSVHPGGVVITPGPLTDFVPVQLAPKGFLITQFDHQDLERLGLPKLDLLGIRALTVLADTAEWIRHYHDPAFSLEQIPPDDQETGDLISRGETIGVFQCESTGAQRTLRQLKARTIPDLAVANAFFKPGPATGGMAQAFIRRYRGEEAVSYLHPALEPILASTRGVLLFQEQILRVATEIAGLSWRQADHLRRGMSKFKPRDMEAMQAQFTAGCRRPPPEGPAFTQEQAGTLWEQVLAFAGYGFNRGHATAYADVSYRSAYLKAHWPAEFFCARLADWGGFHHPAVYAAEAHRLGIAVRPPHINYSSEAFTLICTPETGEPVLYMGLGQVRDLRQASIEAIIRRQPFQGIGDLLERVPLQEKEIRHLIQSGALDGLDVCRAAQLAEAVEIRRAGSTRQMAFHFGSRQKIVPETAAQRLAWEKELLGWPVSVHPLELVDKPANCADLRALRNGSDETFIGSRTCVAGVRLPGWTGGPGFFLGDGDTFAIVKTGKNEKAPLPWLPLQVTGRWLADEWGSAWLQAERIDFLYRDQST